MSEAQLNILNYALLALLYLFFARVLWAVWSEVRGPRLGVQPSPGNARAATHDATLPASRPPAPAKPVKPAKGVRAKRGTPSRLVVLEPKVRKGSAYPIAGELTLGRAPSCSIGLPDDTFASQLHTRLFARDGAVWVEDLGSTNGTHVNGGRLTAPLQLTIGDRVQIGSTIFEAQ
ncbi:MAG: FHA domain-containing protein [Actinobacteria bacterium]|nr:FHA domain-containing protein [Acidimicrobiaceae bacterium]MBP6488091.1 FHA domain-containing protein [Ilumatobacteraceae bacterium]NMD22964.1 FHA domain-containing protein [Actinomycetota bacterium]MBK9970257.1 FHA domain-containing protein [Acidimicrobiaceae bacterium]MBP7888532.1 FHA domain-containing protein [Ilumatobacteraceae bacterium]